MKSTKPPQRGSIRTQLVVTNIAVLTVLMVLLGVIIHFAVASTILKSVDSQLEARARGMAGMRRPPGPPGGDHGPGPGFPFDHPPDDHDHGQLDPGAMPTALGRHVFANGRPDDHGPRDWGPHPPTPADAREFREQSKFRPRRFTLDGKSADPFPIYAPWSSAAFVRSRAGAVVLATITVDGQRYRMMSLPYPLRGPAEGVIQDVYPLADIDRAMRGVDRVLWTLSPLALLLAGLAGWVLTGRVLGRVSHMTIAAARIGAEDFSRRIPVSGRDEFSQLGETFNSLLGRLQGAIEHEKQVAELQRRFTADASHEFKTPLTIIKGNTDMALTGPSTESDYRDALREIDQAADTMSGLVRDLLLLARADAGRLAQSPIDVLLIEVIGRAVNAVKRQGAAKVIVDIPGDLTVHGNEDELTRLFTNLLDNALRYTPSDGTVTASATVDDGTVRITVKDMGAGIAPEHLPHLGERFYRIDSARARTDGGTGLGLSICKSIVEAHGGSLTFDSATGEGTTVTVVLPQ